MQSASTFNTTAVVCLSLSTHTIADTFAAKTITTTIQLSIFHFIHTHLLSAISHNIYSFPKLSFVLQSSLFHPIISVGATTPIHAKEGEIMSKDLIKDALTNIENIALAYTIKTSSAATPEQFLDDYMKNKNSFMEIKKQHADNWMF